MKIDCLVAEIGSTTTVVNAFNIFNEVKYLGKGISQTTVETDVLEGLLEAIENLKANLEIKDLSYDHFYASSSAAGGLTITVHGLVYEMTAKAAKEAALNAGGNIKLITANLLDDLTISEVRNINPNLIIVSGGTNYGEKDVAYNNLLNLMSLNIPIIYTGNIENHNRIKKLNNKNIFIVENVYPKVDYFNIMPLREKIYETFEKHIIHAKGMGHIFDLVKDNIIPTPGAVMDLTMLLNELYDGVLTIDVGGATTDVHSISEPKEEYKKYLEGEPKEKRTVEGDLGVYINRMQVKDFLKLDKKYNLTNNELEEILKNEPYIPKSEIYKAIQKDLIKACINESLNRHIGDLKQVYTTNGLKVIPEGKDLTNVKSIFLTGGALINDIDSGDYIRTYLKNQTTKLSPSSNTKIFIDKDYIFASLGVLSRYHKKEAIELIKTHIKEV
jgi:uncharacterized protein (TIGR01319 family)